jgi:hypothetical protein
MHAIWKFPLRLSGCDIEVPKGAKPLSFAFQNGDTPTIWVLCDPSAQKYIQPVGIFPTGAEAPSPEHSDFVGTAFTSGYVFHCFWRRA